MTSSNLRFSPSILSRLGEELVPHFDQGIIELVRNAYDADATTCTVKLSNISNAGGTITITDNGSGMTTENIVNGWLVLGYSSKRGAGITQSGRVQVGDKGLGRLAALRMGKNARLQSKAYREGVNDLLLLKASVNINWDDFDNKNTVDEVKIDTGEEEIDLSEGTGTTITIECLKNKITKREAERLARSLTILSNPFENISDFNVILEIPEFPELEKMVKEGYLSEAEWVLKSELDHDGYAKGTVLDWKGDVVWEDSSHTWFSKKKDQNPVYKMPPAKFEISIFSLEKSSFAARSTNVSQLKKWLKHLGGVHVYHNGFRVHPYGDQGSDWLDMNLSRVNDPSRPSTNNSLGQVKIFDKNKILQQKTDRVGFIEGTEYAELKRFIQDSLNWYSRRRNSLELSKIKAKKDKDKQDIVDSEKSLQTEINKISNEKQKNILKEAVKAATSATKKRARHLESDLNLYRSLATAGTTSAVFSHEISKPLDEIPRMIISADNIVKRNCEDEVVEKYTRRTKNITGYLDRLAHFAKLQLNLLKKDKRRIGVVNIHDTLENICENFDPLLEREKIKLTCEFKAPKNSKLNGAQSMLEAIVTNCFTNSMRAFRDDEVVNKNRHIKISTYEQDSKITIEISDSGPGIVDVSLDDIWIPGFTTMPDGTGFGLTIIKDCVSDLGGSCKVDANGALGGAVFFFEFGIL